MVILVNCHHSRGPTDCQEIQITSILSSLYLINSSSFDESPISSSSLFTVASSASLRRKPLKRQFGFQNHNQKDLLSFSHLRPFRHVNHFQTFSHHHCHAESYLAPLPAKADPLANFSFRLISHSLPVEPPAFASLFAFISSLSDLAFSLGSITTNSSSAFFL